MFYDTVQCCMFYHHSGIIADHFMAEKAVAEVKDTDKDLLEKITDMDVFRREDQVLRSQYQTIYHVMREICIKGAIAKVLADLSKAPVPKQIAVGGAAGWTAGYLTMKAGKMAATAIGGTLLLLQIAHHKGYIKV